MPATGRTQSKRTPEGKEGAGAQQEGRNSKRAGRTNRRASSAPEKRERKLRSELGGARQTGGDTGRRSPNDHQKTVQGKNQRGPDDKVSRDVGGGNQGSKGQNSNRSGADRMSAHRPGKQSRDLGDERGQQGGSGGGQKNRQNKAVNQGSGRR